MMLSSPNFGCHHPCGYQKSDVSAIKYLLSMCNQCDDFLWEYAAGCMNKADTVIYESMSSVHTQRHQLIHKQIHFRAASHQLGMPQKNPDSILDHEVHFTLDTSEANIHLTPKLLTQNTFDVLNTIRCTCG